jgi:glycosyltransferase involved in cell wall biosynthesis
VSIVSAFRVGLFTECYRPIQNGIVASLDALAHALRVNDRAYALITPAMPKYRDDDSHVVRIPSFPLPTRTAYRLTVPYLSRPLGDISIVHAHSPFVTGWLGARVARHARVPLVFTYHTQLEAYAHYVPFQRDATRRVARHLTRAFANGADAVIVPTRAMESHLRALGVTSRIEIVPSGIDCARFARGVRRDDLRARFGVAAHERLSLVVGRLGREKNVDLVLEAFARLDDTRARLAIVGEGTHRAELERACVRLGIASRVYFAGESAREDLPDIYASADAFVFTSRTETQGLVLVEALASGVPIVAIDTPATADVLGGAGTLVSGDATALAAALGSVLDAGRFALRRSRDVSNRFDGDRLGARVIALYDELVDVGPTRTTHAGPAVLTSG